MTPTFPKSITFTTRRVRVPESGVVRLPGRYAHDFASIPLDWREIREVRSKFVDYPTLTPGTRLTPWTDE